MTSKWNQFEKTLERAHNDLFETTDYTAEFYNQDTGNYDPSSGQMNEGTRSLVGSVQVEIVPPSQDSTVSTDGTDFDWSTSIRFPESASVVGSLVPLGVDSELPTEVEVSDPESGSDVVFELHSYTMEKGSGMVMARLQEN